MAFASETPDTKQSILGSMATAELTEGLSQTGLAEVVAVPADSTVRGAGIVVSGSYLQIGDSVVFKVRITDAGSGTLLTGAVEAVGSASRPGLTTASA